MEVEYICRQRVAFTPAHIQLACDGVFLALPLTRTTVGVWSLQDITFKPLELVGHRKILTALALSNLSTPKQLVSAAEDFVIIWDLLKSRKQFEKGEKVRGRVIGVSKGYVQYCSLCPKDSLVAVCTGSEIVILDATSESKVAVLEGHNGTVTAAEFCPHYTSTLVSVSDDRTFKVWNLEDLTLVYQSPILTAFPFLSVAMSIYEPRVAIGAADGVIRIFDLTDGNRFRCLHQIDIDKLITKKRDAKIIAQLDIQKGPVKISSRPTWKQAGDRNCSASELPDLIDDSVEAGSSVLGLYYTSVQPESYNRQASAISKDLPFLQNKTNIICDLLTDSPMLMVGTTAGMLQFNARTLEICNYLDFQDPVCCENSLSNDAEVLNAAGSIVFSQGTDNQIWCIVGSPFQNVVHVLRWNQSNQIQKNQTIGSARSDIATNDLGGIERRLSAVESPSRVGSTQKQTEITVLSKVSLLDDSPLRADMTPKPKDSKDKKYKDSITSTKKGSITENQPLTFKTKIKSSGYSAAPRTTMFKPQTHFSTKARAPTEAASRPTRSAREYPVHGNPPMNLNIKVNVAERPTAINYIKVSDGGQNLACALANRSSIVYGLPLSNKSSNAFTGHNHIVTCVNWSHTGLRLLTSSDDKTACVWIKGQSDPVMTFDRVVKNTASLESQVKNKDNNTFNKEVHFGQFYFMDKFILLCAGNQLYMYKYCINLNKNDIQRKIRVTDNDLNLLTTLRGCAIGYLVSKPTVSVDTHLGKVPVGSALSTQAHFYEDGIQHPITSSCGDLAFPKQLKISMQSSGNTITQEECLSLEESTRDQADCPKWLEARKQRLTASQFGMIAKRKKVTDSFIKLVLEPKGFNSKATNYGTANEKKALKEYCAVTGFHVHKCGLIVNPELPFLGASPDGKVCIGHNKCGLVEVKCPFSARDKTIKEACVLKDFCLFDNGIDVNLRKDHNYFYQVQGQLLVSGADFCDFVVYTKRGNPHIERITLDEEFCKEMLNVLNKFYTAYCLL